MTQITWVKQGNSYSLCSKPISILKEIPKKVYNLELNPETGELFLSEYSNKFSFNSKIYNLENKFIEYVFKTYKNISSNLGILLNGYKGSGKTWVAKQLANKFNLPIIMVNKPFSELGDFISKINFECVIFFDEFEKTFSTPDKLYKSGILSLLDGIYTNSSRKIFLITSNDIKFVSTYLTSRPSRIRYFKEFKNLPKSFVLEYIEDNLINKDFKEEIFNYINTLEVATIDILKTIIEEVNIHNTSINSFKNYINIFPNYSYRGISILERWVLNPSSINWEEGFSFTIKCSIPIEELKNGDIINDGDFIVVKSLKDNIIILKHLSEDVVYYVKLHNIKFDRKLYN